MKWAQAGLVFAQNADAGRLIKKAPGA